MHSRVEQSSAASTSMQTADRPHDEYLRLEVARNLAGGCDAHLIKPIKKRALLAAIDQYRVPPSMRAAA